jgi:hypothetical protein
MNHSYYLKKVIRKIYIHRIDVATPLLHTNFLIKTVNGGLSNLSKNETA